MADNATSCLDVEIERDSIVDAVGNAESNGAAEKTKTDESEVIILESSNLGALGQLSGYLSDSDDSVTEISQMNKMTAIKNNYNYRISQEVVVSDSEEDSEEDSDSEGYTDYSSTTSSSSSSTAVASSDDSDKDSDVELYTGTKSKVSQCDVPRTEGELGLADLPPIEDLHITVPKQECMELGQIESIVDTLVVVQAKKNSPALDLDSVLFLDQGNRTLGKVFDVFGPVSEPCYCVRFNSRDHIDEKKIEKGMLVYCAPRSQYSSYVFLPDLLKMRGSDASWEANNEPPPRHLDYSDDEEERLARRASRSYNREGFAMDPDQPSRKKRNNYEQFMNSRNLRMSAVNSMGPRGPPRRSVPRMPMMDARPMLIRPPSFTVPPPRFGTIPLFSLPPPPISVPRFDPTTPPPQSPVTPLPDTSTPPPSMFNIPPPTPPPSFITLPPPCSPPHPPVHWQ